MEGGETSHEGSKNNPMEVEDGDDEDGDKQFENLSPAELIALLRQNKLAKRDSGLTTQYGTVRDRVRC